MLEPIQIFLLAFSLEMIDNGFGGGFGTILSPLLIIFGYEPTVIVPSILISETVSGIWGGFWHWKYSNVDFKAVRKTMIGSIIAMCAATYLIGVVLSATTAKLVITGIVLLMAVINLLKQLKPNLSFNNGTGKKYGFTALGFIAGFNKGSSGGGYGPLSVIGYMLLGLPATIAIGTTTIAEGAACLLGVVLYSQLVNIVLTVALPMTIGAFLADPISAIINDKLGKKIKNKHDILIGAIMFILGTVSLLKTLKMI